jgi:predicted transcriptional regulator
VFEVLQAERELGYTTVLKTMQIMTEKGLVLRDESAKSHVYRVAVAESETKRTLVADMMTKAFAGSASQLLVHALTAGTTTEQEFDAIQRLLDEARGRRS